MSTSTDSGLRPAVRAVDVQHVEAPPGPGIVLFDRLGISEPTFVPAALLPVVGRCDGSRTIDEIRREASRQVGEELPLAFVRGIVRQLDERRLLVGPAFTTAAKAAAAEFLAAPFRPPRHAGAAGGPADPGELRQALRRMVGEPGPALPLPRGLVAPHIDLERGRDGYRAAYNRLLASPAADLYVVFGTGHAGPTAPITGLELDWSTPLGTAPTDRAFVRAVHAAIGGPDPIDVLLHRDEHSLEFQVLFLQHLHERRGDPPPRIAGFLCGSLPSADGDPLREAWCQRLVSAFRAAEAAAPGRVCYLAGADLAHVGPTFGDAAPVDGARLERLAGTDRAHLEPLLRGEPGAFHRSVVGSGNPDRICSAPAITLCAELAGGTGELLHYGQACAADGDQVVTFCAGVFTG